jgi:hypothetical protein
MRTRPLPVTVAIVLLALGSLANLLAPLILPAEAGAIIYIIIVLGVLGLVAVGGLWMLKRWALWLTIVISVLNILAAAPGLVFAPDLTARVLATLGVVGFAVVIVLVLLPDSRRAYT